MLLCEPNVSEGRSEAKMARFVDAVASIDVALHHASADPDHNRMVLAYSGTPPDVLEATRALASAVLEEVDLRLHRGQHPRIGALDVIPFVVGPGATTEDALEVSGSLGEWLAAREIPVFFYERAARRSGRGSLPQIRAGQFEGLEARLRDPDWRPDLGPATPHPTAGASVVGVRDPLVRFNVNLETTDPRAARAIARQIRTSSGGLPNVRALGLELERRSLTQVSMNLTRFQTTSIETVFTAIRDAASELGVVISGCELIGSVPAQAIRDVDLGALGVTLEEGQVLDLEPSPFTGAAR